MRNWLDLIAEAPIDSWTVDQDFDANAEKAKSRWSERPNSNNVEHWSAIDRTGIRHGAVIDRIKSAFLKVPFHFNLYFYQSDHPNYDRLLQAGVQDATWLRDKLGDSTAERILSTTQPDAITVVLTGNLSDEGWISIRSPWMLAHRIAHSLIHGDKRINDAYRARNAFEHFIYDVATIGYGVRWPDADLDFHGSNYYMDVYTPVIAPLFATMRSAREDSFVTPQEWYHETFAQWLIRGRVTLNSPPEEIHPEERLTHDREKLAQLSRVLEQFPKTIDEIFTSLLEQSKGKIYVM